MKTYRFPVGPFKYSVTSDVPAALQAMDFLYADYPRLEPDAWVDFDVRLMAVKRSLLQRNILKCKLNLGSHVPFPLFTPDLAGPMLEWGMNWCLWLNVAHLLIFHAAMLELNDNGLILAADSGDGKSTLAAGLALAGWRLLSDELTLLDPDDTVKPNPRLTCEVARMVPLTRPICMKNESIDVIQSIFPDVPFTGIYRGTTKGDVSHIRPSKESVRRATERVTPRWVVFPKFVPGKAANWTPWEKAEAFIQLGRHGNAYSVLGGHGFRVLAGVVTHCDCWRFEYGDLTEAIREFRALAEGGLPC